MMVIGCEAPVTGLETNLWNCGGSLAEAGLESPGTTCPGSAASQVRLSTSKYREYLIKRGFEEDPGSGIESIDEVF